MYAATRVHAQRGERAGQVARGLRAAERSIIIGVPRKRVEVNARLGARTASFFSGQCRRRPKNGAYSQRARALFLYPTRPRRWTRGESDRRCGQQTKRARNPSSRGARTALSGSVTAGQANTLFLPEDSLPQENPSKGNCTGRLISFGAPTTTLTRVHPGYGRWSSSLMRTSFQLATTKPCQLSAVVHQCPLAKTDAVQSLCALVGVLREPGCFGPVRRPGVAARGGNTIR